MPLPRQGLLSAFVGLFALFLSTIAAPEERAVVVRHGTTPEGDITRARADAVLALKHAELVGEKALAQRLENMIRACDVARSQIATRQQIQRDAIRSGFQRTSEIVRLHEDLAEIRRELQKTAVMRQTRVGDPTDKMNFMLEKFLQGPSTTNSLAAMKTELTAEQLDSIYLTDGRNTFSAKTGRTRLENFRWPFFLQREEFGEERAAFEMGCDEAIKQINAKGTPSPEIVLALLKKLDDIGRKVDALPLTDSADVRSVETKWRKEAKSFLRELGRTLGNCSRLDAEKLSGYVFSGATLGELVAHMEAKGLRFSHPSEDDENLYASVFFIMRYAYHGATEQAKGGSDKSRSGKVVELLELKPGGSPWFSRDGLTIYYEGPGTAVWTARRRNANSAFQNKRMLFPGRHVTVSADGLEMILLVQRNNGSGEASLHSAVRDNLQQQFPLPREIDELSGERVPKSPCLSSDHRTLYFNRRNPNNRVEIAFATRPNSASPWSVPRSLPIRFDGVEPHFTWPHVSDDGLKLLCACEGGSMPTLVSNGQGSALLWTRTTVEEPFDNPRAVEVEVEPGVRILSPRYVAATRELFFTVIPKDVTIRVAKDFRLY